jgi:hypothetical protein
MIDLTRYRGIVIAAAGLLATLAVVDGTLTAVVGPASQWLPHGDYPADRSVLTSAGGRIAGAERDLRRVGADHKERFGVLLGQSTLECGIDPAGLDAQDGLTYRWLNLYGEGGSVHKIDDLARLLFAVGPKPDLAVIAVNPYMLVGNNYDVIRSREALLTRGRIKPWIWTWENRGVATYFALTAAEEVRLRLFHSLGLGVSALYPPDPTPWQLPSRAGRHWEDHELMGRLEYNRGIGWLEPKNYTTTSSNAQALAGLFRACRERGIDVVLVLMPLRRMLREALPPESRECLAAIARDATPGRPVPIVDLESDVPDEMFLDLDHLNAYGRELCTRRLAERLDWAIESPAGPP